MDTNYTWSEYAGLPFDVRDGVEKFWEPGYDYSDDSDIWDGREGDEHCSLEDFKAACQMYDWLQKNDPE